MKLLLLLLFGSLCLAGCQGAVLYAANVRPQASDRPVLGGQLHRRCEASPPSLAWRYRWTHPNGGSSTGAVLSIQRIRPEDFGTYTCVAEAPGNYRLVAYTTVPRGGSGGRDGAPATRTNANPRPNGRNSWNQSPSVLYETNIRTLASDRPVLGGQLHRRCEASPPSLAWRYRWTHPNGGSSTGAVLSIQRIRPEDFGTYTCVAEAPGNYRLVAYTTVSGGESGGPQSNGNDLPGGRPINILNRGNNFVQLRIRSTPEENLVVGGTVRRRCFVDRPGFTVIWTYPDGRRVPGELLSLDAIHPRDQGVYRCQATGLGVILNGTFHLSFERVAGQGNSVAGSSEIARIRIDILPGENFIQGGTVRRQCRVSQPGWSVTWRYPDGRNVNSGYLWLNNLSERDAGTYLCIARKNGAELRVTFRISFQQVDTVEIRAEPGERLELGGTVRRRCSIGRPNWSKVWIFPNGRRLYSDLLTLTNIAERHQGIYVCEATGEGRSVNATFILRLETSAQTLPRIRLDILPGENFIQGGTVRRQCRVSQPGWSVTWRYPDGRNVNSGYLWLNNLSERDAGTYLCIARKNGAELRVTFRISFQQGNNAAAQLQIVTLGSENPQIGGSLRRECRANEAGWQTTWRLPNGRTLPYPILFIERLGMEHAGTYTCIAQKGGQRVQRSFEVQLQSGTSGSTPVAKIALQTLEGENFAYGGTVRRKCVVSSPGWTLKWQYPNGRKIDSSYLWLDNLNERDSGTYWCIATKDGAKLRLSFRIAFTSEQQGRRYTGVQTVEITIAPRIEENLVIGGTVHRRCQATNGTWIVTWLDPRGRVISGNDLDLSRIRFAQLGRYKCIARARNGEEVTGQILIENATLSQLDVRSLTIRKLPSEQLRIGGVVQRRCVAPEGWNVHWQLPTGGIQAGDSLRIDNLSPANAGAYLCVAEGPKSELLKSSFRLTLIEDTRQEYTTLRIRPLEGENLIIGGTIRKDCIVSSAGWDVHWMKPNGDKINSRYLTVSNLRTRDSGRYECIGVERTTQRRLMAWFSFRLEETQLQTAEINVRTLPGERLVTGGSLRRRCVVTRPGWTIYWTRPDGSRIDSDTLTIDQLTPRHSGRYICHARQSRSGAMMSSWFSVAIRAGQSFTNVDVNILPGESLTIGGAIHRECVVTSPDWDVYWVKPNGGRVNDRYLRINNLQLSNSGRYTCFAKNRLTQQTLNTWFTVNTAVGSGTTLRIEEHPGDSLIAGGKVRRRCVASTPGWTIYWTLPDGSRINGGDLQIDNLEQRHSGRYTCKADNNQGLKMETWFSFRIVQVATIHMDTMPDEQLRIGGVLSQRCRMTEPGWRIRWELPNGSTVLSPHLRITNLSRQHYGKYWCIATNQTGESRRAWYQLG